MNEKLPVGALYCWIQLNNYLELSLLRSLRTMSLGWQSNNFQITYNLNKTHFTITYEAK
jgi:hypothetical protein